MKDINGMILKVGDKIRTTQGVVVLEALIAPDNDAHQGELVRVKNTKGQRSDIRLRLSRAEYTNGQKPTGFTLGDMLAPQLRRG